MLRPVTTHGGAVYHAALLAQDPRTSAPPHTCRQYAYKSTGLSARGVAAHAAHPPRQITVLDRRGLHGRGVFNHDEFSAALNATGLPVQFVGRMDHLSFEEQVRRRRRRGAECGVGER